MSKKRSSKPTKFSGRIVDSQYDYQTKGTDVLGPHHVIYPKSTADVATAVNLSQKLKTYVRSGVNVATQDVVDGTGGVVINMREMAKVTVKENSLKAQAAATGEMITKSLAEHNLAIPLSDNPRKSIASGLLFESSSYLARSLGPLSDYVSKVRAVKPDGKTITIKNFASTPLVDQCKDCNAVITEVDLEPASASGLWMYRVTFPYPGEKTFSRIASFLFNETKFSKQLRQTDLALDAFNGPYNIPLVRISALGSTPAGKNTLRKILKESTAFVPKTFELGDIVEESFTGFEVMDALAETGMGANPEKLMESVAFHDKVEVDGDFKSFLARHVRTVHQGVAFVKDKTWARKLSVDSRLSTSLRVNRANGLEVTGHSYSPIADTSITRSRATPLHRGVDAPFPSELLPILRDQPIPNFKGDVYSKNDWGYRSHAKQYATSSYPSARTSPYMIAYPRDESDIFAAIGFAKGKGKRIVARSGGHQYSGKSSGGQDTIVLSMESFDQFDHTNRNTFNVGPSVLLEDVARRFSREGVTIPHGECPHVAIGGHAQTGGYGHLVRSFGLCSDYVVAFDIILADETVRTVTRPRPSVTTTTENDELFWGVLSGNAGSFGIITNYEFEVIQDTGHPNSYGFTMRRRFKESAFLKLMKQAQKWTSKIEQGNLEPGIDFMMTVASSRPMLPFAGMLVELVHANLGGASEPVDGDQFFKPIINAAKYRAAGWNLFTTRGQESLSSLSQSFVRFWPGVTVDGREFKHPFKKRINCTMSKLSDDFVSEFVQKVSHVLENESRVKLVFQMLFGGGAYKNSDRRAATSIPHRDYVYCFVFDLFYMPGGEEVAEQLQEEMQDLINEHYSNSQERRVFWGSFGDTDISKPAVRQMYYDDDEQYARLQLLKQKVDPDDVFHTSLTVKLPDSA